MYYFKLMNKLCKPVPHPETPEDYPNNILITNQNLDLIGSHLGFSWMRSSRLSLLYHFSLIGILKFTVFDFWYKKALSEKLELLSVNSSK